MRPVASMNRSGDKADRMSIDTGPPTVRNKLKKHSAYTALMEREREGGGMGWRRRETKINRCKSFVGIWCEVTNPAKVLV